MKVPILFIFFNRPQVALRSFEKIKKYKPANLYLASDGYRENKTEEKACVESLRKEILSQIDWDCEIKTLFREKNLGCGPNVFSAINWLFENESYGVILEDDCVVQDSFFGYMEELLIKYMNDQRVGMIAGYNSIKGYIAEKSYLFSTYKACWGWGTWRRAWKNMDFEMKWRNTPQSSDIIFNMGYKGADKRECIYKLFKIDEGLVSAWDWQWYFSLAAQRQLCIFPSVNLVSNIGFGKDATHTSGIRDFIVADDNLEFPLKHPDYILPDIVFDKKFSGNLHTLKRNIRDLFPTTIYYWFISFKNIIIKKTNIWRK